MSKKTKPEYLTETTSGVLIALAKPVVLDGVERASLEMREPMVADLEIAQAGSGSDTAKEMQLFANLIGITAADVRALSIRNYRRIQEAYGVFTD